MSWRRDGDHIEITLTVEQYQNLVWLCGLGTSRLESGSKSFWDAIRIANVISDGNPGWSPYQVPDTNPANPAIHPESFGKGSE